MKNLVPYKIFENSYQPKIGDYVLSNNNLSLDDVAGIGKIQNELLNLLSSTPGKITNINQDSTFPIEVEYHIKDDKLFNILRELFVVKNNNILVMDYHPDEIYFGTLNDINIILQTNKYNL